METSSEGRGWIYVCGICNEEMRENAWSIGYIQYRTRVQLRKPRATLSYKEANEKWVNLKVSKVSTKNKENTNVSFSFISCYFSAVLWSRMLPKLKIYFLL